MDAVEKGVCDRNKCKCPTLLKDTVCCHSAPNWQPFIEHVNEFQHREFLKHKVLNREKVGEQMIEVLENLLRELEPMTNVDVFI